MLISFTQLFSLPQTFLSNFSGTRKKGSLQFETPEGTLREVKRRIKSSLTGTKSAFHRTSSAIVSPDSDTRRCLKQLDDLVKTGNYVGVDEKSQTYDSSSKLALFDILNFVYTRRLPVPLFDDIVNLKQKTKKVCVTITTASRGKSPISYLIQTVTALLARMNYPRSRNNISIQVFNVDREPGQHREVNLIKHLVPVTDVKADWGDVGYKLHGKQKENLDFIAILRILSASGCRNVALIEDDALADVNWLERVESAISELERRPAWYIVKLFVARKMSFFTRVFPGITDFDQGFNTVAFLLNKEYMTRLADFFESHMRECLQKSDGLNNNCTPKDLMLADFAKEEGLKVEAFEPVLFQHTGFYSSLDISQEPTSKTWFMESANFESDGLPITFDPLGWEYESR